MKGKGVVGQKETRSWTKGVLVCWPCYDCTVVFLVGGKGEGGQWAACGRQWGGACRFRRGQIGCMEAHFRERRTKKAMQAESCWAVLDPSDSGKGPPWKTGMGDVE